MTTSGIVPRRSSVRSIAITGVMPLPRDQEQHLRRRRVGQHEVALGQRQPDDRAGLEAVDEVRGEQPSGIARTVIEMVRPRRCGGELTEYDRHWNLPLTWTPMPTYWPGRWS